MNPAILFLAGIGNFVLAYCMNDKDYFIIGAVLFYMSIATYTK